ncbi:hypothetical protein A4X13_0g905 [Tilletia indica]|uniref:T-cell immunomodulatory protein TIP C2 domain-containing protein n=1 Tax=Tilletia indica TaxID=43049 RepID=A0A177TI02_9BASI|nr:hypothetical protein A4X13_0g905 [Tilletia indica]
MFPPTRAQRRSTAQHSPRRPRSAAAFTTRTLALAALLATAFLPNPTAALFGFGSKRFQYEGLINAGSLGLEGVGGDGEVVALSHVNADHFVDAFVLSPDRTRVDVYLWDHAAFAFHSNPASSINAPSGQTIVNVVPADFDYDGRLDLMLMTQAKSASRVEDELRLGLYLGQAAGGFSSTPIDVDSSTLAQPLMLDASGDMRTDFLAHPFSASSSSSSSFGSLAKGKLEPLQIWRNNFTSPSRYFPGSQGFVKQDLPFYDKTGKSTPSTCQLAHPHSSAFVDLNGDCLADLFLVCQSPSSSSGLTYEIWIATNEVPSSSSSHSSSSSLTSGYVLSHSGDLPAGSGALSFADMDRDGTIDVVFPSCESGSGGECHINVAYNRQIPLCVPEKEGLLGGLGVGGGQRVMMGGGGVSPSVSGRAGEDGDAGSRRTCRQPGDLCTADPSFQFNFSLDLGNKDFLRIPVSELLRSHLADNGRPRILLSDPHPPLSASAGGAGAATPLPLHLGDFNKDGYPDILLLTSGSGLRTGGSASSSNKASSDGEGRVWLLQNVRAFDASSTRAFAVVEEGAEVLRDVRDARAASWMDVDEDGTLDILLQRTGADNGGKGSKVTFIQNNFFHDAFFLKALTLNGACQGFCTPEGQERFKPWGNNYGGASYKFTVLDTNGQRKAQHVGQLPQTGYRSLLTPYSYFGLGRTNNYVESLFVGSTRRRIPSAPNKPVEPHYLVMEGVVPNSEVLISPWEEQVERQPPSSGGGGSPDVGPWMAAGGASTSTWRRELFLQPGDWIPWVTIVLVTVVLMLGAIVFVLHLQEKREDERERKRAVHEINFAAL